MSIKPRELADLIREIEYQDPIDYGDLPYDEEGLRQLVATHICDMADSIEALSEEDRTNALLAVAAKLVLENVVLQVKQLKMQGALIEEDSEALMRRLLGKEPPEAD